MNIVYWFHILVYDLIRFAAEWLPVSRSGHLLALFGLAEYRTVGVFSSGFGLLLGPATSFAAAAAALYVFGPRLNPFPVWKDRERRKGILTLWLRILAACIPVFAAELLIPESLRREMTSLTAAAVIMILGGILSVTAGAVSGKKETKLIRVSELGMREAVLIGAAQLFCLIPGTSRTGITVAAALFCGCSRYVAAEFSFCLAVPVLTFFGAADLVRSLKDAGEVEGSGFFALLLSAAIVFTGSVLVLRFLMHYIRRHNFNRFSFYRIFAGMILAVVCIAAGF